MIRFSRSNSIFFSLRCCASNSSTSDLRNLDQSLFDHHFPGAIQAPHLAHQDLVFVDKGLGSSVNDVVTNAASVHREEVWRLDAHTLTWAVDMTQDHRLSVLLTVRENLQAAWLALG